MILAAACLLAVTSAHAAIDTSALRAATTVGDCTRVASLLEGQSAEDLDTAVQMAGARCHAVLGDRERALALARAGLEDAAMAPWPAMVMAEILMASDGPADLPSAPDALAAQEVLDALDLNALPSELSLQLRMVRCRALLAQDRGLDARDDLRAMLETELGPEARYWLAFAAEQRGDTQPAVATYRATWIRHAASPWSNRAADRLAALGQPVPDLSTAEGRSQSMQRLAILRDAKHAGAALGLLREINEGTDSPPDAKVMASACFDGRDYDCAIEAYARLGSPAAVGPETLYKHALATYRAGDYPGAVNLYTALHQRYPSHGKGDTGSYKIGYSALDQGLLDETIAQLRAHLERFPSSKHADESLWFIGWCHWKQGRSDEAILAWAELVKEHPGSSLAPGAAYWKARAAKDEQETRQLHDLVGRWPENGRAWLALEHLGELAVVHVSPSPPLPALPEAFVQTYPQAAVVDALLEVGLADLALAAIDPVAAAAKGANNESRLAVARRLAELGEPRRARRLANTSCNNPAADPQLREICLPRPHVDVVNEVLDGSDLDPYLPFAIMTAESALQPGVTSGAGARGLMQVMPDLGERLHAVRYSDRPYDPSLLYQGAYNASLGTSELRRLHEHFRALGHEQTLPLVIAGYNGGQEAVERWLSEADAETPQDLELDAWSEDISYGETRRYVRRVLGYLRAYHLAYGE